jgi:hypothetical protein
MFLVSPRRRPGAGAIQGIFEPEGKHPTATMP